MVSDKIKFMTFLARPESPICILFAEGKLANPSKKQNNRIKATYIERVTKKNLQQLQINRTTFTKIFSQGMGAFNYKIIALSGIFLVMSLSLIF